MGITHDLAQPIVDRLHGILDCPISITNSTGIIIASSVKSRLGTHHEAALKAIASQSELRLSTEQANAFGHTFEGITLPIILHDTCVGALCLRGNPEELKVFATIISIAVLSLLETAEITSQLGTHQRMVDTWVTTLISSSVEDYEQIGMRANILGIDFQQLCTLVVIRFHEAAYSDLPRLEATIIEVASSGPGLHFLSYVGLGQFVCAIPLSDFGGELELQEMCKILARKLVNLKVHFHIGVGRPNRNIQGYRQSYHDASHSARVAERLGDAKRVLYYNEQHIFRLLESVPDYLREIFIDNQTEGREWDPILLETLQTYFAMNCHVNETARALYIHRNTLLFRLNKIADSYNLDPRKFHDAVVLQVLLYLLQLSKHVNDDTP